jgi:hypothetical protein
MVERTDDVTAQGRKHVAVTPSDANDFALGECRALFIGLPGDISVLPSDNANGEQLIYTISNTPFVLPLIVRRVLSTGTTAGNIRAIY